VPRTKCSRCGRLLTDALSIRIGVGPECRQRSPSRRSSKASERRLRVADRTIAFSQGEPVTVGKLTFTQQDDGSWTDGQSLYTHEFIEEYLTRYHFILPKVSNAQALSS